MIIRKEERKTMEDLPSAQELTRCMIQFQHAGLFAAVTLQE